MSVAPQAGLTYRWSVPGRRPLNILQSIGNGCAFLDYDNDGSLDILLVGPRLALYRGDGHGHFTDVTHQLGLDKFHGHFLGCAVGDYDNDGYDDLYVSGYRTGLLLHNEKGKGFRDVTKEAGLKPQPWGTSAAFGDIDNDGKLDLYVGDYLDFDPKTSVDLCPYATYTAGCPPSFYPPERGVLYHNEGSGKFRDVTEPWGMQAASGYTLGVAFADTMGTGRQSLYLANDKAPGDLFRNDGTLFMNDGLKSGTALTQGERHSGMGVDWGDYDNDGKLDLVVGTFSHEPKCIYHNEGNENFTETSAALELRDERTMDSLTFGTKWLDCDNDGWLDLMLVNGHVNDNIADFDEGITYRQTMQLFRNDHGRRFVDISAQAGPGLSPSIVGRGLAVGDYDNDGRMDALVVDSEGAPLLLHNESSPVGHWLELKLEGTKSNRDGYGATVTVVAGGLTQTRLCHADGSYLSSSDRRVHVGLGSASEADQITIRWPSGHTDVLRNVPADQIVNVREGSPFIKFAH